jgi:hypothetical protein
MKKLLFLLLTAPMIGNSQMLNLPIDEIIVIEQNQTYTVPNGKILQLLSTPRTQDGLISVLGSDWVIETNSKGIYNDSKQFGNVLFKSGTKITWKLNNYMSMVLYNLDAQNLAYNSPQKSTPTLYPNPTSSLLALNSDKEYEIEVYDMAGNKVMALTGNTINMEHLSTATYIVRATDKSNNEELTYKVVKN